MAEGGHRPPGRGFDGRFVPDCDFDKALALLFTLHDLTAANGKTLRDNYRLNGFNWFGSQVDYRSRPTSPCTATAWIFEAEFNRLEEMIEDGFVKSVSLEVLDSMAPLENADCTAVCSRLFNTISLGKVLDTHLLPRLA